MEEIQKLVTGRGCTPTGPTRWAPPPPSHTGRVHKSICSDRRILSFFISRTLYFSTRKNRVEIHLARGRSRDLDAERLCCSQGLIIQLEEGALHGGRILQSQYSGRVSSENEGLHIIRKRHSVGGVPTRWGQSLECRLKKRRIFQPQHSRRVPSEDAGPVGERRQDCVRRVPAAR